MIVMIIGDVSVSNVSKLLMIDIVSGNNVNILE